MANLLKYDVNMQELTQRLIDLANSGEDEAFSSLIGEVIETINKIIERLNKEIKKLKKLSPGENILEIGDLESDCADAKEALKELSYIC